MCIILIEFEKHLVLEESQYARRNFIFRCDNGCLLEFRERNVNPSFKKMYTNHERICRTLPKL
jgi:hypothetical protein